MMKFLPILVLTISAVVLPSAPMPDGKRFTNSIGMEFVRVEPGSFQMGFEGGSLAEEITKVTEFGSRRAIWVPEKGDFDEQPAHRVSISKPLYLGTFEVTNEQFEKFDPLHAYLRGKSGFSIDDQEAVVFVTWRQAKAYCDWLAKKEGLPYRLPTEAEWEYACRAGTTTAFSTGQTLPAGFLKNPDNSWYPEPHNSRGSQEVVRLVVGQTPANPWGLFDMHGNVEEWCSDWYGPYEPGDQRDPVGRSDGDFKVTRGGSHSTVAFYLRSANRLGSLPDDKSHLIGFRVALGPMPETAPSPEVRPEAWTRASEPPRPATQKRPQPTASNPDPRKPYFYGPREYVKIPPDSTGPLFSGHNHDPGIVEAANGDLFAIWYSTETERGREMTVASSRLAQGQDEWEPASLFWDAPDRNDHAPALWFDGDRTIYQFLGLSSAATWGPLAVILRTSTDNGLTWTRARLIAPERGPRHQPVESVFRTREGYLVLPCDAVPGGSGGTALLISRDGGKNWADPGGTIAGIHAGVTQLKDGSLLAFGRSDTIDGMMPKSVSDDMGRSWKYEPSVFPPIGGGQRLVLLRLKEGPLFLASFAPPGSKLGFQGLFAALSYDEGKTWPKLKVISDGGPERELRTSDGRPFKMTPTNGEPRGYMSVCQGKNGVIHLISSINHYAFNLKWVETK